MTPTTEQLFALARDLEGEQLCTLHRKKPFRVSARPNALEFTPGSGKPRPVRPERVAAVLTELSRTGSFHTGVYSHLSFDASYVLTLAKRWQDGGRDESLP